MSHLRGGVPVVPLLGAVLLLAMFAQLQGDDSSFSWMWYDHFDEIDDHMKTVSKENCRSKAREELVLRPDTVAQLPVYNQLLDRIWYPNRTSLIHLHNMALNRAFFYSFILQKMNSSKQFYQQPNWLYMYMSATADVNSNPYGINGSAIYFDRDCHYPNWYRTIPFNNTIPLFGPKAWRHDDYQDQENLLREPTRQVVEATDMGAGRGMDYTHEAFKMNPWFNRWLPDLKGDIDSLSKFTYSVGIKYSDKTGSFTTDEYQAFPFFGPASPSAEETDERMLPVVFTQPYFDCGRSDKWIVSAVSPVVDFMPRYSNWTHLRRSRFVGVVVTDTDFIELDFNACGVSDGNPGPSYLSGIDRCQKTTGCKHKYGYGFRRGGYICHCKGGYTYPWHLKLPYQGDNVEQSTDQEYKDGFKCTPVDHRQVLPKVDNLEGVNIEGGSSLFNSGGVRLDEINNPSSNSSSGSSGRKRRSAHAAPRPHPYPLHNMYTVDASYRVRNLRAVVDLHGKGKGEEEEEDDDGVWVEVEEGDEEEDDEDVEERSLRFQKGGWTEEDDEKSGRWRGGGSTYFGPLHKTSSSDGKGGEAWMPVRSKPRKPHGVHADIRATHDRKPISWKQIETVRQHRLMNEGLKRMEERKKNREEALEKKKEKIIHNSYDRHRRKRDSVFDQKAFDRMMRIFRKKASVTKDTCHNMAPHTLIMPGDVAYGAEKQFESEARTALRLAHFLSNFFQNTDPDESFGNLKGGGTLLEDVFFAETLTNVMSNVKILSSGIFFDRYKFEKPDRTMKELFGPWAFRRKEDKVAFYAHDSAGLSTRYTDEQWFRDLKGRWSTNFRGLQTYKMRAHIRSDPNGTSSIRHEHFPLVYKAPTYEAGYWREPHFRCDGWVDAWVVTYITPFFGLDKFKRKLEFRGVITVDMPLDLLELNQCPQPFGVANAFKNTARCDYFSTWCRPQQGFKFMRGAYRCDCRQGFEYFHLDGKFWIEGSLVELEYEKKKLGLFSRFDDLRCRIAAASTTSVTLPVLVSAFLFTWIASKP